MCGIYAALSASHETQQPSDTLKTRLIKRGPDHLGQYNVAADAAHEWALSFASTVLALRGSELVKQPLINEATQDVLCWNGEAWRIGGEPVSRNDGLQVLDGLTSPENTTTAEFLRSIDGPFAFVFFSKREARLYFGRDRLGRRSLLMCQSADSMRLSSLADDPSQGWREVEADGFYSVDLLSTLQETVATLTRHPWAQDERMVGCSSEPLTLSVWPATYACRSRASAYSMMNSQLLQ